MPTLFGRAPAKVNLALKVLGRRTDGYHELRTIFQTISLADRLVLRYQPRSPTGVKLTCSEPKLSGKDNLAARAADQMLASGGWRGRVTIELEKRIPVGAGLGGGSSDAGAVLLALRRLLKPPPQPEMLLAVAADLGSDVPFFLVGGTALGIGRGEEVYPLPDRPVEWMVILAPDLHVSTAEAYHELSRARGRTLTVASKRNIINGFCSAVSVSADGEAHALAAALQSGFENDFEAVIFQRYPKLQEWKKRLVQLGASRAMISGSGAALFGVFASRARAIGASRRLAEFPGRVEVARILTRRSHRSAWSG